jgi:hypothetical protein
MTGKEYQQLAMRTNDGLNRLRLEDAIANQGDISVSQLTWCLFYCIIHNSQTIYTMALLFHSVLLNYSLNLTFANSLR